jgi:two-component system, NarL family, nitrate/nitrite response regulator NarL
MANNSQLLRLLIVDDHAIVREGLRMLIESQPAMQVVGVASNRAEAFEMTKRETPDLILLDLDLGNEDGLNFLPELRETAGNARVLILTGLTDPEVHRQAVRLGASGVVLKQHAAETLIKAIERVHAGEVWLDRTTMGSLLREMTQPASSKMDSDDANIAALTTRELQVIALIAEGLKNKVIAERLFISETTVTHHLSSIFSKLGVSDRLELVIYAFGHNLVKMPR